MTDLTGQSIGRYQILERLGEGGMAIVYKARDTRLDRDVALKLIRVDQFAPAMLAQILKRFEREAKSLARLSHPNIVTVHDYGEHDGAPYLVLEYCPGGDLKHRLRGQPMDWQEAIQLILPVARALRYSHRQGVIHRDVKPSNVMFTGDGEPKLSDFGIAKILEHDDAGTLTGTGVGIGTPGYMAPEQWTGETSQQSDQYGLGVVLYELLTGRKPYEADTPAGILIKQTIQPLPNSREFVPDLPASVEQVLLKALAKDPADRHADMDAFVKALESILVTPAMLVAPDPYKTVDAIPVIVTQTIADSISLTPSPSRSTPAGLPEGKERRVKAKPFKWLPWGIGAVVLMLIALSIISQINLPPSTPVPTATPTETRTPALTATLANTSTPRDTAPPVMTLTPTLIREIDQKLMVYVPAGEFLMGSDPAKDKDTQSEEQPQHSVYLDAYWIDQTEVINGMYALCVSAGKCTPPQDDSSYLHPSYYGNSNYADYPVIYVEWNQAKAYCAWAGADLPTEAQWEKAARGTDGRLYPWGKNSPSCDLANYGGCIGDTTAVKSYESGKSLYGAYDMAGNVWEWVNDWYATNYYSSLPERNPQGPTSGEYRVLRGGTWSSNGYYLRSAYRYRGDPSYRYYDIGFRCARSP